MIQVINTEVDNIEELPDGSVIQHGKYNDRIYLIKRGSGSSSELVIALKNLSHDKGYSKIFAKVKLVDLQEFIDHGFVIEAFIPKYFAGGEDLFMVCFYSGIERLIDTKHEDQDLIVTLAQSKVNSQNNSNKKSDNRSGINFRKCNPKDIPLMVSIYKSVFPTYPFPINESDYLLKTMKNNVDYYCAEDGGKIVALSSSEIDYSSKSSEMTDFATLPIYRGAGLARQLLNMMEKETAKKNIKTFYTIARAKSAGMNIIFAGNGYRYGGRLKNNTNISGQIESMNVWYKTVGLI
ncbi:MAG: putative beta-lysine N-acetyltransferase [Deltaproteobacteria bacterium]|nr:putative beta-lysine N-acetyltransferase [Deltaproteobacteria bacterium]